MVFAQTGQAGAADGALPAGPGVAAGGIRVADARWSMSCSRGPSISVPFLPSARAVASCVQRPDMTTKPPAASRAAVTPSSWRTPSTPTSLVRTAACTACSTSRRPLWGLSRRRRGHKGDGERWTRWSCPNAWSRFTARTGRDARGSQRCTAHQEQRQHQRLFGAFGRLCRSGGHQLGKAAVCSCFVVARPHCPPARTAARGGLDYGMQRP